MIQRKIAQKQQSSQLNLPNQSTEFYFGQQSNINTQQNQIDNHNVNSVENNDSTQSGDSVPAESPATTQSSSRYIDTSAALSLIDSIGNTIEQQHAKQLQSEHEKSIALQNKQLQHEQRKQKKRAAHQLADTTAKKLYQQSKQSNLSQTQHKPSKIRFQ